MKIEKRITSPKNYGDKRDTKDILYIVIDSIDNGPSCHYHIANGKAYQIVPDNYMSDSINGARLSRLGVYHGICTKYNSISIGIDDNPSDEEIDLCFHTVMMLLQRYAISLDNILRKVDVTGTAEPEIWFDNYRWNRDIVNRIRNTLIEKMQSKSADL